MNQAQAQSLVDFYVSKTQEAVQQPYQAYKELREGWVKEAGEHPDLRGKMDPGGPVLTSVAKMLNDLGDPQLAKDFRQVMDMTGAGDHPAFIRTFYRLAQRLTEGQPTSGSGPSVHGQRQPGAGPITAAQALYPNLPTAG